ncbi:uncharacterized protein LOC144580101 isoform X5 [Callithrix jacchus]
MLSLISLFIIRSSFDAREIRGLRQFMEAAGVLLFQGFEKNRRTSADTFGKTKLDSTSSGMEQTSCDTTPVEEGDNASLLPDTVTARDSLLEE